MNILVGKTKEQIKDEFCERNNISSGQLETLLDHLKYNFVMGEKTRTIVFGLTSIIFGLSFIVALIIALTKSRFPMIFPWEEASFLQMFVDIFSIIIGIAFAIATVVIPIRKMNDVFDWGM